ncbi:glycosyltransferase N-terminal domain-containing protein [Loktanella sp. IMCC34160]|uniref:3-deoxy-D-manno-octulosonic acid transferase n=1 Tax=Loktanella sp. IMCC34160 TaxID=2510646 RepID=UPI0013ECEF6A|nr:glycosyltransferase N-terminal domain-containing protein [Loktanella sp. IMCC34160]
MQHRPSDRAITHNPTGAFPAPVLLRLWRGLGGGLPGAFKPLGCLVHARQGAAPERRKERFGLPTASRPEGRIIWIHGASLGEVSQLRTLVPALERDFGATVVITTMTQTGADWVAGQLPDAIHQFQPMDTPRYWDLFFDYWRPDVGLVVENDLWPTMLSTAAKRGVPMMVLNARASRSMLRHPRVYRHLLGHLSAIHCRNEAVAGQFDLLGVGRDKMLVGGDLKAFGGALPLRDDEVAALQGMIGARKTWIAASTHPADEPVVLKAAGHLKRSESPLLVWAPRHPKRAAQIIEAAEAAGLTVAQRSRGQAIDASTDIYLADTTGEMGTIFALSDIVFLGGGFGPEGGHNPYEPAREGKAVLSGPGVRHFAEAFDLLTDAGGAAYVHDAPELAESVLALLKDEQARRAGQAGQQVISAMPNPIDGIIDMIQTVALQKKAQ